MRTSTLLSDMLVRCRPMPEKTHQESFLVIRLVLFKRDSTLTLVGCHCEDLMHDGCGTSISAAIGCARYVTSFFSK